MTTSTAAFRALTAGLAEIPAIACSSMEESALSDNRSSGTTLDGARPTLSLSPAEPPYSPARLGLPLRENVAPLAMGLVYITGDDGQLVADEEAYLAIDGAPETIWNSKQPASQWLLVVPDRHYLVDRVELVITQRAHAPTTHEIWLGHGSGLRTFRKHLSVVHTQDALTLAIPIDPPQSVNEMMILALHNPSWVEWNDFRVFGRQREAPNVEEETPPLIVAGLAAGLEFPVPVTHVGEGSGCTFVVELSGRIRII